VRDHDVSSLTAAELERARRDLRVSMALAMPGSPVMVAAMARMAAIDTELAACTAGGRVRLCSCGFASDDPGWFDGHLHQHPGHHKRSHPLTLPVSPQFPGGI
jgi:hypothetical protein